MITERMQQLAGVRVDERIPSLAGVRSAERAKEHSKNDPTLKNTPIQWFVEPVVSYSPSPNKKGMIYITAYILLPEVYDLWHSNVLGRMEQEHGKAVSSVGLVPDRVELDDNIGTHTAGKKEYGKYTFSVSVWDEDSEDDLDTIAKKIGSRLKGKTKVSKTAKNYREGNHRL